MQQRRPRIAAGTASNFSIPLQRWRTPTGLRGSTLGWITAKNEYKLLVWRWATSFLSSRLGEATERAASSPPEGPPDMSKTGTTRVTVKPGEAPPHGETDWARVNAMTDEEVLAAARSDPDAQPLDSETLARMRRVSPVKVLRQRLGMTQAQFAEAFRLPISTLRDWEQHRSTPDAPARALLRAIEREPETMRRLLSSAA